VIDRHAFAKVMGGFADKIGRALAPETSEMYYDVLSESLTTDEFLAGARIVFRTHAYNVWPPAQLFIDAIKPKEQAKLSAAEVFERVLEIAAPSGVPFADRDARIVALGPLAVRAFRAAGGRREFEDVLEADVKWIRKAFIDAYDMATTESVSERDARVALAAVDATIAPLIQSTAAALSLPKREFVSGRDRAAGSDR
jgi:hypothetical protein